MKIKSVLKIKPLQKGIKNKDKWCEFTMKMTLSLKLLPKYWILFKNEDIMTVSRIKNICNDSLFYN